MFVRLLESLVLAWSAGYNCILLWTTPFYSGLYVVAPPPAQYLGNDVNVVDFAGFGSSGARNW